MNRGKRGKARKRPYQLIFRVLPRFPRLSLGRLTRRRGQSFAQPVIRAPARRSTATRDKVDRDKLRFTA